MFSDQFCPKNEQLTALTRLEVTSWYQAKDPVDDYINRCEVCLRYFTKSLHATVFMQTVYSTVVRGYS